MGNVRQTETKDKILNKSKDFCSNNQTYY